MAASLQVTHRARRLYERYRGVLDGKNRIDKTKDAELFLEAISTQESPRLCVEQLIRSTHGLGALGESVRSDLSLPFIQKHTLKLFVFLSDPSVRTLSDGQFLWRVLNAIVSPPTLWEVLIAAFLGNKLEENDLLPLAWLVHRVLDSDQDFDFNFLPDAKLVLQNGSLGNSKCQKTRELACKIQKIVQLRSVPSSNGKSAEDGPGGRHDNDFVNFRDISILPSKDELLSTQTPFLRTFDEVFKPDAGLDPDSRAAIHLDNQFRLLREDMLSELRTDLQAPAEKHKGKRRFQVLSHLTPVDIDFGNERRGKKCCVVVQCKQGLHQLERLKPEDRARFLKNNPNYLKHQSLGVLIDGAELLGFAYLHREESLLAAEPPRVCLQLADDRSLRAALMALKRSTSVQFAINDTSIFAFEPVLKVLQTMRTLPLASKLMDPTCDDEGYFEMPRSLQVYASRLLLTDTRDGEEGVMLDDQTRIDLSQRDSLLSALTQPVSVIQGPPGTGKTFIGGRAVHAIHKYSDLRVLVITYTNHALDDSLAGFLRLGIPEKDMVRLGSKSTPQTASMLISKQPRSMPWTLGLGSILDSLKSRRRGLSERLNDAFADYRAQGVSFAAIYDYLEFAHGCEAFHDAFTIPARPQGWKVADKKGKSVKPDYLFGCWKNGDGPGIFTEQVTAECEFVWDMSLEKRKEHLSRWIDALILERVEEVRNLVAQMDRAHEEIDDLFMQGKVSNLLTKRIICCTTTAAAMNMKLLRAAKPDVVLVEEAGEVLESHTLTALAPSVKQLISIGDHKQLRPKVNNYALTLEKGDGYGLNISLFERLVIQGFPHTTLQKQHRMHPDIALFPKALTYPNLLNGPNTPMRDSIKGLRDRVIFINHEYPEANDKALTNSMEPGSAGSRMNPFEAHQILMIVRYLAQQGYGTDRMVVLAPYLGQVRLLRDTLAKENDPILNDLDASELMRAGLMTQAAATVHRRPLRISTVDNYQGEESDIVIASLTRSNNKGDIGFMFSRERLNVLITRARCCLILLGNMNTFMESKKGRDTWLPFFELLKDNKHLYDGLPVQCVRHDTAKADIKCPEEFERFCPEGGCTEPCKEILGCGIHVCPRLCHRAMDHSKTDCMVMFDKVCERKHKLRVICSKQKDRCKKCTDEDKETERRIKRDLELERRRLERSEAYRKELQAIEDEKDRIKRSIKDMEDQEKQKETLAREKENLKNLADAHQLKTEKHLAQQAQSASPDKKHKTPGPGPSNAPTFPSSARDKWEAIKRLEGARSEPLDELMGMVGLEEVKEEFLGIKITVDTKIRQKVPLEEQRYGAVLLGNPGTGKTTVARMYAKFLTTIGAIAGSVFEETTGAKLAHIGVQSCEKMINDMLNKGGGVVFIDEAYQLTSGNNPGGAAVLDFLLAEVENLMGKIAFVLAGYNKQMESFFAHNPGLPSRFPIEMKFADYSDEELLHILGLKINKSFGGRMKCEDGMAGLYCRIVARRVGRGRGKEGFGNARSVENMLDNTIIKRQAKRLSRERQQGLKPDDFLLTKEDLIGPRPSDALTKSPGWRELQGLFGLQSVKQSVQSLVSTIEQNYDRELAEQSPIEFSLNKVFLGNPGTGKTTVAKVYGRILADIGFLSKGEVLVKNPSDFMGAVIGGSEQKTKGILAASVGKVLVIDEAYGLFGGGGEGGQNSDPFKTAIIDTIVAEVQSVPGDDRCVLLLGYEDQMEKMFQNVNPGLSRRFPISSAFRFEDFGEDDLRQILDMKLKEQCFEATDQAKRVAMEILGRARNRPNFGNAGEIDIMLDATKARHQSRLDRGEKQSATVLEALDFDPEFDRAERSETNVKKLFDGTVGADDIVAKLEGYQQTVRTMKTLEMDPKENVPFNFLFRGPPGTGKTTTAKKMGKVFYDMGFLASADVVECSTTDLIGKHVGHTGPKVLQLLDKALGKVLFIDEAYRLAEGHFAKEAMDELVDSATKPRYFKKLVIILAGYTNDINRLMDSNPGLTSRFPEVIDFRTLNPEECIGLLRKLLAAQKPRIEKSGISFDISALESPRPGFADQVRQLFLKLSGQDNWASARDVQTVSKDVFKITIADERAIAAKHLVVKEETILAQLNALSTERGSRAQKAPSPLKKLALRQMPPPTPLAPSVTMQTATATPRPATSTAASTSASNGSPPKTPAKLPTAKPVKKKPAPPPYPPADAQRDAGVSDEVWEQLARDKQAARDREAAYQKLVKEAQEVAGDKQREAEREAIVRRLLAKEDKRRKEMEKQARLKNAGKCPVGYDWVKQAGGYRCMGGSHFLPDSEVERLST